MFSAGRTPTPKEAMTSYLAIFHPQEAKGEVRLFVYPYMFYGYYLLLFYLLIPHKKRPWLYKARWLVFAVICWWHLKMLRQTTSLNMGIGFVVGIVSTWGTLWAWKWLILERPQWEGRRVEARKDWKERKREIEGTQNGSADIKGQTEYFWQYYPEDNFREKLNWTLDLLVNFRLPGWNYAILSLPALPPSVLSKLGEPITPESRNPTSRVGLHRFNTHRALALNVLPKFILFYFIVDLIKVLAMNDPYFTFGPNNYPLPHNLSSLSPLLLRLYRQALAFSTIVVSLELAFLLAPLMFCLLPYMLPFSRSLRSEPHYYPTSWGSAIQILDHGLPGLWAGFWHQTFRSVFFAPSSYIVTHFPALFPPKSVQTKLLTLGVAFALSGFIHAGGSLAQFPHTKPLHPPIFFALQALGVFLQNWLAVRWRGAIGKVPKWGRRTGNLMFVVLWGMATANWLVDDFARGGIWLYEPVPISVFRGLGCGHEDEFWWCWGKWSWGLGWYGKGAWWERGLAL